jgi:hypothetical protein
MMRGDKFVLLGQVPPGKPEAWMSLRQMVVPQMIGTRG